MIIIITIPILRAIAFKFSPRHRLNSMENAKSCYLEHFLMKGHDLLKAVKTSDTTDQGIRILHNFRNPLMQSRDEHIGVS